MTITKVDTKNPTSPEVRSAIKIDSSAFTATLPEMDGWGGMDGVDGCAGWVMEGIDGMELAGEWGGWSEVG
jgi:hypothetical protein